MKAWLLIAGLLFSTYTYAEPLDIAQSLLDEGKIDDAISILNHQLKQQPDIYQYWFLLGVAQTKKGNFDEATTAFQKVVELEPTLAEPHNNLAVIYNEQGNYRAAVKELESSLELRSDYPMAEQNIADMYLKLSMQYYKRAADKTNNQYLNSRYELLQKVRDLPDDQIVQFAQSFRQGGVAENAQAAAPVSASVPAPKPASEKQAILALLESWRQAWSSQNLDDYFSHYANDYHPAPKHGSLAAWKKYKARVISNKKFIQVDVSNVHLTSLGPDMMVVEFDQLFKSDRFKSEDHKWLKVSKGEGEWKIIEEGTQ